MDLCRIGRLVVLGVTVTACGGSDELEPFRRTSQHILGGTPISSSDSPVVYIKGPQGDCSGVLVAPTLVATARHCTAVITEGVINCTPSGDLVPGTSGGQLGADQTPGALGFYSAARVSEVGTNGPPEAVGAQIVSTQAPSACRDDLSFVILASAIPGLTPAPIRIGNVTVAGEAVSVRGYGFTDQASDPTVLRTRDDAYVVAVGPNATTPTTQPAPVRAVRIGPGSVTCNGDSGGPILSTATGAVIGVVSLGAQAGVGGLACTDDLTSNSTTGPVLFDYRDLVLQAFAAAGATPIDETRTSDGGADAAGIAGDASPTWDSDGPNVDANGDARSTDASGDTSAVKGDADKPAMDAESGGEAEEADSAGTAADSSPGVGPGLFASATGASCGVARGGGGERSGPLRPLAAVFVMVSAALRRRRGN